MSNEFESLVKNSRKEVLYIVPYGGCGEFGMNTTGYIYRSKQIVVDCGIMFPDPTKLGIDCIVPNVDAYFAKTNGIEAYFLTHGHEDHIGAIAFLLDKWPAPIYATAWTVELIRQKLTRNRALKHKPEIITVAAGDSITVGDFTVDYVHVNHSIPMACALVIKTKTCKVFHTADFKFDRQPIYESPLLDSTLKKIGGGGIDLVLADSTGAMSPGDCPSESTTKSHLKKVIKQSSGATVVTTFASNLWRLLTILEIAKDLKKRVLILGRGFNKTLEIAATLNMVPKELATSILDRPSAKIKRSSLIVVATGCQGEGLSALSRIARGEYRDFRLAPGDSVVFSSRVIPGNEKIVGNLTSLFEKRDINVFTGRNDPGIHVSGHGNQGDLTRLIKALKPKFYLPMHGSFSHLKANLKVARLAGLKEKQVVFIEDGDIISFNQGSPKVVGQIETPWLYIDSYSQVPLKPYTVKQRLKIGELGAAFLTGVYSIQKNKWLRAPTFELFGVELSSDSPDQMKKIVHNVSQTVILETKKKSVDEQMVSECGRLALRSELNRHLHKKLTVVSKIYVV